MNDDQKDLLYRMLGLLMHDVARLLRKRFERNAKNIGLNLTRAQWSVLSWLVKSEGVKQCQLAEFLDIEPITLARQIDILERLELVERRADPRDRRAKLLYLCPKAHAMLEQGGKVAVITRAEATAGLSEFDKERLVEILLVVKSNLSDTGGPSAETGQAQIQNDRQRHRRLLPALRDGRRPGGRSPRRRG